MERAKRDSTALSGLKEVERARGWIRDLAACFDDHRSPALIEYSVSALLKQRLFGLALGYEDLTRNSHKPPPPESGEMELV